MSGIRQRTIFGSNHVEQAGSGSPVPTLLALGAAGAMVTAAAIVAGLVGGALAIAILIFAYTGGSILLLRALTRSGLEIAHWRRTGELPQRQPLIVKNTITPPAIEPPQHVTWSATRVYPEDHA